MIRHIRLWNNWRKRSLDSKTHKFMVLIKAENSPSLEFMKIMNNDYYVDKERKCVVMSKGSYGVLNFAFDLFMCYITGGLWLLWIVFRYMRR